jgi:phytoene/squalene synthetase
MLNLFSEVSQECSKLTTEKYSTSFSRSIKLLHPSLHTPIFNIYGFVRFADEIVDTFHEYDKVALLSAFKEETYAAIARGISLNPILNSFQLTVNQFNISHDLIEAFFKSMEMDLSKDTYDLEGYKEYIYGSAEVVGLMCLYVFCDGDEANYQQLKPAAQSLGAAFQKVNFLRDIKADFKQLSRTYFPGVDFENFTKKEKAEIEEDIMKDFKDAFTGIIALPEKSRFGVYVAYQYYLCLFDKIKKTGAHQILVERIRVSDYLKTLIVAKAFVRKRLNLL